MSLQSDNTEKKIILCHSLNVYDLQEQTSEVKANDSEGVPDPDDDEHGESEEITCEDYYLKVEESIERNEDKEINEADEATIEYEEETPLQDEYDENISEEQAEESYEEHDEESDTLKQNVTDNNSNQCITRKEAALRTIHRPRELPVNLELAPGTEFAEYSSFMSAVHRYSQEHGVTYVTAFSKTVASRNKDCRKTFSEKLRFTHLRLRCKYGGAPRQSSACVRAQKMTCKVFCPSTLTVVAHRNPDRLLITMFVEDHNHELEPTTSSDCETMGPASRRKRGLSKTVQERSSISFPGSAKVPKISAVSHPNLHSSTSRPAPMVVLHHTEGVTSLTRFSAKNPGGLRPISLRLNKNAPVVPFCRPSRELTLLSKSKPRNMQQGAATTVVPPSDNVIDITDEDETESANTELSKAVARVNDAWKCVYRLLEEDHSKLRAEAERLRADNKRLRAACEVCGNEPS